MREVQAGLLLVALALTPTLTGAVAAQDFNVDVGPLGSTPPPATYAAAGQAGVWNSVTAAHTPPFTPGPTPQDVLLVDIHGNPTAVGFHQFGGMDNYVEADPLLSGDDATLLNDYLATHSLTLATCPYLNGLANGTYEVITYAWMPKSPSTTQRVNFDLHPGQTIVGGSWTGSHVEGVTYSRNIIQVTTGNIGWHIAIPAGEPTQPGAAFNGFQVRRLTWQDLGGGTSGVAGPPLLSMTGPLTPASAVTLDLVDAAPLELALVFVSFTSSPTGFLGGTLYSFPFDELVIVGTDGAGELHGLAFFPGAASGQALWFQVGIRDLSVPVHGATLSNAVQGTVP